MTVPFLTFKHLPCGDELTTNNLQGYRCNLHVSPWCTPTSLQTNIPTYKYRRAPGRAPKFHSAPCLLRLLRLRLLPVSSCLPPASSRPPPAAASPAPSSQQANPRRRATFHSSRSFPRRGSQDGGDIGAARERPRQRQR